MIRTGRSEYVLSQNLGEGSTGSVVSGYDVHNDCSVAIKIVDLSTDDNTATFYRESKITRRFESNSHLCEFLDIYSDEDTGYFIMKQYEYDLFTIAFEMKAIVTEQAARNIFMDICLGLKSLHDAGIAHMDLKPENILLDNENKAYLCDFGSSFYEPSHKSISNGGPCLVRDLGRRGTAQYYAPEIVDDHEVYDPYKSDVFSLGVILYLVLAGKYPYNEEGGIDVSYIKGSVSENCFNLLELLLHDNPEIRLPINQIIVHPWFQTSFLKKKQTFKDRLKKCVQAIRHHSKRIKHKASPHQ